MKTISRAKNSGFPAVVFIILYLLLFIARHGFSIDSASIAQSDPAKQSDSKQGSDAEQPETKIVKPLGPTDEYNRGVPRGSLKGFLKATRDGDYKRASQYLDLRYLPDRVSEINGHQLARRLKIVLDKELWFDLEVVSDHPAGFTDDGMPANRDVIGRLKTPEKTVDLLMQRVPRGDGAYIWKISNQTVAEIPHLYEHFGYGPFGESMSKIFPDAQFLGWQVWQWILWLINLALAFIVALLITWFANLLISRKDSEMRRQIKQLVAWPVRFLLWLLLEEVGLSFIGLSMTVRTIFQYDPVLPFVITWTALRLVDLLVFWWGERLGRSGREDAIVLLRPARTAIRVTLIIAAALFWLDNIGLKISTLIAGLGVGGLAVALAAQDTLKNLLGSIMILLDKPYKVGQRIVAKGHDGIVEEIGLRSTRLRLLSGHQTTIPNDEMAKIDIENIGQRPHIRRVANIGITYDTPPGKIEKAVDIILNILDNHEGMVPGLPPRAYFSEYNSYSLNIIVFYWYHPADYWAFMKFTQWVNLQIAREFQKEGIKFAFPTSTTYLSQEDNQPLQVSLDGNLSLDGEKV
ncbi:Potassium efflux system KefA protein / Small-conductance mechanosensitive channel [Olavius algarvensis Delta 1 endosymbiont]|nr:Potassium efflux system KefA protein / Small-conductance mechanosensitive channel [Olavius algarvensis Delta 1 endosymbiont]